MFFSTLFEFKFLVLVLIALFSNFLHSTFVEQWMCYRFVSFYLLRFYAFVYVCVFVHQESFIEMCYSQSCVYRRKLDSKKPGRFNEWNKQAMKRNMEIISNHKRNSQINNGKLCSLSLPLYMAAVLFFWLVLSYSFFLESAKIYTTQCECITQYTWIHRYCLFRFVKEPMTYVLGF